MTRPTYRYLLDAAVPMDEASDTLLLAIIAAQSLHGESQVRLDAVHAFDPDARTCVIDAGTGVGRDLNRLFAGFLVREFGTGSFRVERVQQHQTEPVTA